MLTLADAIPPSSVVFEQSRPPETATKVPKVGAIVATMSAAFFALYGGVCMGNTRSFDEQAAAMEYKSLDLTIIDLLKGHCTLEMKGFASHGLIFEVSSPPHGTIGELTVRSNGVHFFKLKGTESGFVVTTPGQAAELIRIVLESLADEPSSTLVTDVDTVVS